MANSVFIIFAKVLKVIKYHSNSLLLKSLQLRFRQYSYLADEIESVNYLFSVWKVLVR